MESSSQLDTASLYASSRSCSAFVALTCILTERALPRGTAATGRIRARATRDAEHAGVPCAGALTLDIVFEGTIVFGLDSCASSALVPATLALGWDGQFGS